MFFVLALAIATIGAGNIAAAALVAPMAMAVASRAGIPGFLMAIMVAHGAIAGALSPFAPTGIIADNLMSHMGLGGHRWQAFFNNLMANVLVAMAGYLAFGGWRLFGRVHVENEESEAEDKTATMLPRHRITLVLIALLIVAVVGWEIPVGMGAFCAAIVLILLHMADEKDAVRAMPWSVILMVCGVTVLTNLLERTGGIDRFTTLQARLATPKTVTGVTAFVTGLISVYSSTSGVVLPVFLPTVPKLVERLGGGNPMAIASSMMIGGHLVDSSPLSTIGALCVACAGPNEDRRSLFNKTLAWGLSMAVVGAVVCYLFFGSAR
jgi:di/tricarboxylate transporter